MFPWTVQQGESVMEYNESEQNDALAEFHRRVADTPTTDDGNGVEVTLTYRPEEV